MKALLCDMNTIMTSHPHLIPHVRPLQQNLYALRAYHCANEMDVDRAHLGMILVVGMLIIGWMVLDGGSTH